MSLISKVVSSIVHTIKSPTEQVETKQKMTRATDKLNPKGKERMETTEGLGKSYFNSEAYEDQWQQNRTHEPATLKGGQSVQSQTRTATPTPAQAQVKPLSNEQIVSQQRMTHLHKDPNPNSQFRKENRRTVTLDKPPVAGRVEQTAKSSPIVPVQALPPAEAKAALEARILADINNPKAYKALVNEMSTSMKTINNQDYKQIEIKHITERNMTDSNNPINKFVHRAESFSYIGANMILSAKTPSERTKLTEFFIDCAHSSYKSGDLEGPNFFACFNIREVTRLMNTGVNEKSPKIPISKRHQEKLNEMKALLDSRGASEKEKASLKSKIIEENLPIPPNDYLLKQDRHGGKKTIGISGNEDLEQRLKDNQNKITNELKNTPFSNNLRAATTNKYKEEFAELEEKSYQIKPRPTRMA